MEEILVDFNTIKKLVEKEVEKANGNKTLTYMRLASSMCISLTHFRNLVFKNELNNFHQLNALAKALHVDVTRLITYKANEKSQVTLI